MKYRRAYQQGATYFFTLVTKQRRVLFDDPGNVGLLRNAIESVKNRRPFVIEAIVVLPNHIHCMLTMPLDDADYSTRLRLIKRKFTVLTKQQDVWQKRFWEHMIRDDRDYAAHFDYIHYNPVKHGLVNAPVDWEYSSFHKYLEKGFYPSDWGRVPPDIPDQVGNE